jgi:hypothetical protein
MKAQSCEICASIPDFASAALREGEKLPDNVSKLVDAYPTPEGFWDTSKDYEVTRKCPLCGTLYTYNYHYDFSVGYIEESVWIERQPESESEK